MPCSGVDCITPISIENKLSEGIPLVQNCTTIHLLGESGQVCNYKWRDNVIRIAGLCRNIHSQIINLFICCNVAMFEEESGD